MNPFRNRKPVLEPTAFYGRTAALEAICQQFTMQPPQCCAVVGLPRSGKTSLLYYLHQQARLPATERQIQFGSKQHVIAIYVNVGPYIDLGAFQLQGALYFWRDIASALAQELPTVHSLLPALGEASSSDTAALDQMYALRHGIAAAIRACSADMVVLLLDNAEGIARLPRATGGLLRTLTQDPTLGERVAYVATSQVPLYQLYDPTTWQEPSSFWNLFAAPIYLGQLTPDDARALLSHPEASFGTEEQIMLLRLAGRHPDLLTLACALLYDLQAADAAPQNQPAWGLFEQQLFEAALPLCQALWQSLLRTNGAHDLLRRVVAGLPPADEQQALLPVLARQGLIEHDGIAWRLFSAIMQRFVQQQTAQAASLPAEHAQSLPAAAPLDATSSPLPPAFTHLESAVYSFLALHAGAVCDRDSIKRAVWNNDPPSDSALQKLIERIREKIEPDPRHPRRLLAVRGQGYILHLDVPTSIS